MTVADPSQAGKVHLLHYPLHELYICIYIHQKKKDFISDI